MATSNSTTTGGGFKPPQTPLELHLSSIHGDLRKIIPQRANEMSLEALAMELSTPERPVNGAWISRWLARHGYVKVSMWQHQNPKQAS